MKARNNVHEQVDTADDSKLNHLDAERCIWAQLRGGRFRGLTFIRRHCEGPYILDYYCPVIRLAVEIDCAGQAGPDGDAHDVEARTEYLDTHGIEIVRLTIDDVMLNMRSVLAMLETRAASRPPMPEAGTS